MNSNSVSLTGCDFNKTGTDVVYAMVDRKNNPEFTPLYSGGIEGYYEYLINSNVIGDIEVPVLIRMDKVESWEAVEKDSIKVLTIIGNIVGALINFQSLISLLKDSRVMSISLSRDVGIYD